MDGKRYFDHAWPKDAVVVTLTVEQLHWLLAGIDLAAMQPHPVRMYTKTS